MATAKKETKKATTKRINDPYDLTSEKAREILRQRFVFCDDVADILALAFRSRKPVVLYGAAGHGKTEMVDHLIKRLGLEEETYTQSFGEGTDEASIWGDINMAALDTHIEYCPERSFLAANIFHAEELFDAPSASLISMKDTLSAKRLRKGAQTYDMKTKVIIACTNKEPSEMSALGPEAHALVERFPLSLEVRWPSYRPQDYLAMFKAAPGYCGLDHRAAALAEVLAKAMDAGHTVSPRTAMHAYGIVRASADARSSAQVEDVDLHSIKYLQGLEAISEEVLEGVAHSTRLIKVREELDQAISRVNQEVDQLGGYSMRNVKDAGDPVTYLRMAKNVDSMLEVIQEVEIPDDVSGDLLEQREEVLHELRHLQTRAQAEAIARTSASQ